MLYPVGRAQKYMKIVQPPHPTTDTYRAPFMLNTKEERGIRCTSHFRIQSLTAETQNKPALF